MRFWLAVMVVGLVVGAADASAGSVLVRPDGSAWGGAWQRWVDEADVETPDGRYTLIPDRCPFYLDAANVLMFEQAGVDAPEDVVGCSYPMDRLVYVRRDGKRRRQTLLHELGHMVDARYVTPADRAAFVAVMARWWPDIVQVDQPWRSSGGRRGAEEAFANVYAFCAVDRQSAKHFLPLGMCAWVSGLVSRGLQVG